jgi:hypothetical protein
LKCISEKVDRLPCENNQHRNRQEAYILKDKPSHVKNSTGLIWLNVFKIIFRSDIELFGTWVLTSCDCVLNFSFGGFWLGIGDLMAVAIKTAVCRDVSIVRYMLRKFFLGGGGRGGCLRVQGVKLRGVERW